MSSGSHLKFKRCRYDLLYLVELLLSFRARSATFVGTGSSLSIQSVQLSLIIDQADFLVEDLDENAETFHWVDRLELRDVYAKEFILTKEDQALSKQHLATLEEDVEVVTAPKTFEQVFSLFE